MTIFINQWRAYKKHIRDVIIPHVYDQKKDISFRRNELFCNIITYFLPAAIVAVVLGVYISIRDGMLPLAIYDLFIFCCIATIALRNGLSIKLRKILFISVFYGLSLMLLYYLSGIGPGMMYLLAITIITSTILSSEAAYYSVLANLIICIIFCLLIYFGLNTSVFNNYTISSWIAISSDLIVLSIVCVVVINRLVKGLETNISERIIAEEEFRTAIKTSSDGFWITDVNNGNILEVNETYCRMIGYRKEELLQMKITDVEANESPEETKKHIENVVNTGHDRFETRHKTKSGLLIDIEVSVTYSGIAKGRLYVFIRDITERKRAEEALRAKHELFSTTFNVSPLPSVLTKLSDRKVIEVNPAFERLFGYTSSEVIGKSVNEIDLWADSAERQRVAQILLESSKVHDIEFVFKTKTGKTGYGIFYAELIEQLYEKYIIAKVLDITGRKLAENEIKRINEMLNETGRLAKVGGWEIDLTNMNVDWTDEVYSIHELEKGKKPSVEEAINFYAPEARPVIQQAVNNAIAMGEGWDIELPFITAKGKNIWVRAIGNTEMKNGKTTRVFGVFQDITGKKKAEEKLKENIQQLEEILFSLSHKVRQPVSNILGVSNLFDSELITEKELKKIICYMKESALNLDKFTHELTELVSSAKSKTEN